MDDSSKDCEDLVYTVHSLLEFQIFVPERMRQKVEADIIRTSLEESTLDMSANNLEHEVRDREEGGGQTWQLNVRVTVCNKSPTIIMRIFPKWL